MISGVHAIIYSKQAERLREFFREVLKYPCVDAGGGWAIFALPPAELAMHPAEESHHELYLMCDDVNAVINDLRAKGVELVMPISDRGWGLVTRLKLPSGDQIGLYQPKHPTALDLKRPSPRESASWTAGKQRIGTSKKRTPRRDPKTRR